MERDLQVRSYPTLLLHSAVVQGKSTRETPLDKAMGNIKTDLNLLIRDSYKWSENEWHAERIINFYDLAIWAQNRSGEYRTPNNMLIRLQKVIEVSWNRTAAQQSMHLLVTV